MINQPPSILLALMNNPAPLSWTADEYASFGLAPQVNRHSYHELDLFDKAAMVALLDDYPRRWLQAFTMGDDACRSDEWSCVDIAPETDGAALWHAVQHGRLWLNITHVEQYSDAYASLIDGMYEHLGVHCLHLQNPKAHYSTLLLSSPKAQVYYHLDAEPNMLWHMRGQKRIWVYPAMDTRFVSQEYLEDIYAGEVDENLPYDPAFDASAQHFLLTPGDVASWPHNGPHRIVNDDMNVSLATSYYTPMIYKRQYVQLANRFVLRNMGLQSRSMAEEGAVPAMKRFAYRAINKARPFNRRNRSATYVTDLQIDPGEPNGIRKLAKERHASFSSQAPSQ